MIASRPRPFSRLIACLTSFAMAGAVFTPAIALSKPPKSKRQATTGQLAVFSFVQGASVEVDGKLVGKIPLTGPLELTPGEHSVRVFARGHTEVADQVTIVAGETAEFEADLIAVAGIVKIRTNIDGATIAVDGKIAGTAPFDADVPAGKRQILVQAPGHKAFTQTVELEGGKVFDLLVTLEPAAVTSSELEPDEDPIYKKWWFWTIIGAVVVGGTVTGVVLGMPEDTEAGSDGRIQLP
ncbi:MAG: PEGA domain-containing protein [Myxococcales bacterium]|nr:PEGA domain-containing protein [Myxococcales bacterium]